MYEAFSKASFRGTFCTAARLPCSPALVLLLATLTVSCVTHSAYSPVIGDKFGSVPLAVERLYVIINFPVEHTSTIAEPLARNLREQLKALGVQARSEIQLVSPLALGSGINFVRAHQYKPQAILLVRMAESGYATGSLPYSYWTLSFDVLDGQGRGAWRGRSSINRLNDIEATANALSQDLLKKLIEESVVIVPKGRNS